MYETRENDFFKKLKKVLGFDNSAAKKAERAAREAQARAEASQKAALIAQQNMQANFAQNLALDNTSTVLAGGTAEAMSVDSGVKKKRVRSTGLASTLGIEV